MKLENISTSKLIKELESRPGVRKITVNPHEEYSISTEKLHTGNTGPTVILEVID